MILLVAVVLLVLMCTALYWIGGQEWAHTLLRDLGCSLCIATISGLLFGWSWYLMGFIISYGGFTIGDHDMWYWTPHALVISLGILPYAIIHCECWTFLAMLTVVVAGTYIVSRFFSTKGIDVISRGLFYSTIPLWFLI